MGYSLFTHCSIDNFKVKDPIKKFCTNLKKITPEKINCEKKEIIPQTKKENNHTRNKNSVTYAEKNSKKNLKDENLLHRKI